MNSFSFLRAKPDLEHVKREEREQEREKKNLFNKIKILNQLG